MPSVIDAVSLLTSALNVVKQIQMILSKHKSEELDKDTTSDLYSYVVELKELIKELDNYPNVIDKTYINSWIDALNNSQNHLFGTLNEDVGIVVSEEYDSDVLTDEQFKNYFLNAIDDMYKRISAILEDLNKKITSGKLNIFADVATIEPNMSYEVFEFIDFYDNAKYWFAENENKLYYFTNLTLSDAIYEKDDIMATFKELNKLMDKLTDYISKFKLDDMYNDVRFLQNMLYKISTAIDIISEVENMENAGAESDDFDTKFDVYQEDFIDALRHLEEFPNEFISLLDAMYKRLVEK